MLAAFLAPRHCITHVTCCLHITHHTTSPTAWESNKEAADLSVFGKRLTGGYIPNLAIVDCTASDVPPSYYLEWMQVCRVGWLVGWLVELS